MQVRANKNSALRRVRCIRVVFVVRRVAHSTPYSFRHRQGKGIRLANLMLNNNVDVIKHMIALYLKCYVCYKPNATAESIAAVHD